MASAYTIHETDKLGRVVIERTTPIYGETTLDTYRQVIGHSRYRASFLLDDDGRLCADRAGPLPGWHYIDHLRAGSTAEDVRALVERNPALGTWWEVEPLDKDV
jgi:hypothetical protein